MEEIILQRVYLDNAATSFPKPQSVTDAVVDFMTGIGASPGRGGYMQSLQSGRIILEAREAINGLFNGPGPDNVIFTQNITESLNIVLKGMLKKGDHVITTSVEHNSVMRPLRRLERDRGVRISTARCGGDASLDPAEIERLIDVDTKAVIMTHASNLTGTILPVREVGRICKKHGLYFIIDTAQTAGILDIDFNGFNADVIAFTGHKGLMGPQGTGGFVISDSANSVTSPLIEGGTGSNSDIELQPETLPDKFEGGTMNAAGIAGLKAGVEFINSTGISNIREHERGLARMFIDGLSSISAVTVYGPKNPDKRTATIPINVSGLEPSEVSYLLDSKYGIATRPGLHCTPGCHRTIGTFPKGTVRFSIGYFNTEKDIQYALDALAEIIQKSGI